MLDYLKSILPRIQQYSKKLDDEANFVEIPWGFINMDGEKETYIFRKNKELLVSRMGDIQTGRWEYLSVIQSLVIETEGKKRLFNQGFLDRAVMILRKDGTEEFFPLANLKIIENCDVLGYLAHKLDQILAQSPENSKLGSKSVDLTTVYISFESPEEKITLVGAKVLRKYNDSPAPNGWYKMKEPDGGTTKVKVVDGRIIKVNRGFF